jgi:hypothetical protein
VCADTVSTIFLIPGGTVKRLLYNSDGTNMFIRRAPMVPGDLHSYVDEVAGSQVTTFLASPNAGQNFYCPSTVGQYIGEDYSDEEIAALPETGDRGLLNTVTKNVRHLIRSGHDPLAIVLQRCRERGLEAFITFRMNELHDVDRPDSALISRFYREHPEWNLSETGHGWLGLAPNFAVPEVRQRRIAEIVDLVERYDIDGLELDFQRFPAYFSHAEGVAEAHAGVITDLVTTIRQAVERVARSRGRTILLAARVPSTLEGCRSIGLDPAEWSRRGLLEFVTIAPFLRTLFQMPIEEFKAAMPGLPVYAGVEYSAQYNSGKARVMTPELYRGVAASLLAAGADGVSLFNMFCARENADSSWEPPFSVLREIGDLATLKGTQKLYLADRKSDFDQPVDAKPLLPVRVAPDLPCTVPVVIAPCDVRTQACTMRLEMGEIPHGSVLRVSVNGKPITGAQSAQNARIFVELHDELAPAPEHCQDYDVPAGLLRAGKNMVEVGSTVPLALTGIEVAVFGL